MALPLPPVDLSDNPTGCCPRFHPEGWDRQVFHFGGLSFITARSRSFLYLPINLGAVMTKYQAAIDAAQARPSDRWLVLSKEISLWTAEHAFLVSRPVPGYASTPILGDWYTRVFEGPYSQMGRWYQDLAGDLKSQGKTLGEVRAWYTTCPKCAQTYGKNYVVLFARVP